MSEMRGALGDWWGQGLQTALLRPPRWSGLVLTPATLLVLILLPLLVAVIGSRWMIVGQAAFFWPALAGAQWLAMALVAFLCWWLQYEATPAPAASGTDNSAAEPAAPAAAQVFAMLAAQGLVLDLAALALWAPLTQARVVAIDQAQPGWVMALTALVLLWCFGAQALVMWRSARAPRGQRIGALALMAVAMLVCQFVLPARYWFPVPSEAAKAAATDEPRFELSQARFEAQAEGLQRDLAQLRPQRAGVPDVYVITFAPDADEAVFARELAMVEQVMQQRFDAQGRALRLVNAREAQPQHGWATPENLQRAIRAVAERMNRDEDLLFIHLSSHGARNGALAASFWPLQVDPVMPQQLRGWLDEAGIRYRIVSVSACFAGSWVAPLAGEDTLVMTAADAEHTSFGCGRKSELTYFGRALYDEALRQGKLDVESAFAQARTVIERREKEAGKSDGYSNPQIRMGAGLRAQLHKLGG